MGNGRFSVSADWTTPDGQSGHGNAMKLTNDSGYFWFFQSSNTELVVKVLNGCGIDNAYWVFAAGLTNVQVVLNVRDEATGATYTNTNPQGVAYVPIQATAAFPTSCPRGLTRLRGKRTSQGRVRFVGLCSNRFDYRETIAMQHPALPLISAPHSRTALLSLFAVAGIALAGQPVASFTWSSRVADERQRGQLHRPVLGEPDVLALELR